MNFIQNLSTREKVMLSIMLVIVVGYFSFTFIIQPYFQERAILVERKLLLEERLRFLPVVKEGLENLEESHEQALLKKELITENLISVRESPVVLQMIREMVEMSDLQIFELRPREVVKVDDFSKLPIDLTILGTYEEMVYFTDNLIQSQYLLTIDSLSLRFDGIYEQETWAVPILRMSLNLNLFLLDETGGVVVGSRGS